MPDVADYLSQLAQAGKHLSEQHMCHRFAEQVLGHVLGYEAADWIVNPHAGADDGSSGTPDITIKARTDVGEMAWIVTEAKLDDNLIRDPTRRAALWADKRKYVTADTVYFLWIAKRTVMVCDTTGNTLVELYLEGRLMPPGEGVVCTTDDAQVREALACISAEQAHSMSFLEQFRAGELSCRYLEVNRDSIDQLTSALASIASSLRTYLTQRWNQLSGEY